MDPAQIKDIVEKQREYFATKATLPTAMRIAALKKLKQAIVAYTDRINAALTQDLGKSNFEGYMCEVGLVLSELTYMIRHTAKFAREKRAATPLTNFAARSFKKPSPYGNVLIMSPWNYPFLLTIDPLVDALAAGNTAVIKPSAYSPATSAVIQEMLRKCFAPEYVTVITGGRSENSCLLQEKFDYIFFTGSQAVGREVMRQASEHLTPVTLELGGKSPCIVDSTAKIKLAAKRIVFGKFLNCGQTCVAPDYIYCDEKIADQFAEAVRMEIEKQFTKDALHNKDYGKIINEKHFARVSGLIAPEKVIYGGHTDAALHKIEPTVMTNVNWKDAVMQEEIFGPVLPILTYHSMDEVIAEINRHSHPLALYVFAQNKHTVNRFLSECNFGGGCVNDVVVHLSTSTMGFGGVGESGMGSYHGREGFATFSHTKSIMDKKTWMDLPMRYQPYKLFNGKLLHMFLK